MAAIGVVILRVSLQEESPVPRVTAFIAPWLAEDD